MSLGARKRSTAAVSTTAAPARSTTIRTAHGTSDPVVGVDPADVGEDRAPDVRRRAVEPGRRAEGADQCGTAEEHDPAAQREHGRGNADVAGHVPRDERGPRPHHEDECGRSEGQADRRQDDVPSRDDRRHPSELRHDEPPGRHDPPGRAQPSPDGDAHDEQHGGVHEARHDRDREQGQRVVGREEEVAPGGYDRDHGDERRGQEERARDPVGPALGGRLGLGLGRLGRGRYGEARAAPRPAWRR